MNYKNKHTKSDAIEINRTYYLSYLLEIVSSRHITSLMYMSSVDEGRTHFNERVLIDKILIQKLKNQVSKVYVQVAIIWNCLV